MTRHREQKPRSKTIPGNGGRRAKPAAGIAPSPAGQPERACPPIPCPQVDEVEEASIESFPASDPPGYGTGHA